MRISLLQANALHIPIADKKVQTIVTSPPYYGLRDYGTATWEGGDSECNHVVGNQVQVNKAPGAIVSGVRPGSDASYCRACGAIRVDNQIGLEQTPEEYVAALVAVFRECWRVLKDDGTLWLNLGDSYAGHNSRASNNGRAGYGTEREGVFFRGGEGLKTKDLIGIPWRVAFALQQPYVVPTCVVAETDRAWLAALMDGEGTFGIRRFKSYREEKKQTYQDGYVVYTSVTNSDIELLDQCILITGYGRARVKQRAGDSDKRGIVTRRDSYGWRLDGNKAVDIIQAAYPYLIAKKKQAILGFTLDKINKSARDARGNKKVPQAIQDKKQVLYELIKKCNQREDVDLPNWVEEPKQDVQPGWYLRSDIIWHKPNPMPESVRDRPTKSHEYIFLLSKSKKYFYDADSIREPNSPTSGKWGKSVVTKTAQAQGNGSHGSTGFMGREMTNEEVTEKYYTAGRNKRTVWEEYEDEFAQFLIWKAEQEYSPNTWTITTKPFRGAHFAVFPPEIPDLCIRAGTSEAGGCPICGAPWKRIVEREFHGEYNIEEASQQRERNVMSGGTDKVTLGGRTKDVTRETIGWQPTCEHEDDPVPQMVLDPFGGSGTTAMVANNLGRHGVSLDLSSDYLQLAKARTGLTALDEWEHGKDGETKLDDLPMFENLV